MLIDNRTTSEKIKEAEERKKTAANTIVAQPVTERKSGGGIFSGIAKIFNSDKVSSPGVRPQWMEDITKSPFGGVSPISKGLTAIEKSPVYKPVANFKSWLDNLVYKSWDAVTGKNEKILDPGLYNKLYSQKKFDELKKLKDEGFELIAPDKVDWEDIRRQYVLDDPKRTIAASTNLVKKRAEEKIRSEKADQFIAQQQMTQPGPMVPTYQPTTAEGSPSFEQLNVQGNQALELQNKQSIMAEQTVTPEEIDARVPEILKDMHTVLEQSAPGEVSWHKVQDAAQKKQVAKEFDEYVATVIEDPSKIDPDYWDEINTIKKNLIDQVEEQGLTYDDISNAYNVVSYKTQLDELVAKDVRRKLKGEVTISPEGQFKYEQEAIGDPIKSIVSAAIQEAIRPVDWALKTFAGVPLDVSSVSQEAQSFLEYKPETTQESILAGVGSAIGMLLPLKALHIPVRSLLLSTKYGKYLNTIDLSKKIGLFTRKITPLNFAESILAFDIYGQMSPELIGSGWEARAKQLLTDTSLAVAFQSVGAIFKPTTFGKGASALSTGTLFASGSLMAGEPIENVVSNFLLGGMMSLSGFAKPKDIMNHANTLNKFNLKEYSGVDLKNNFTDAEIDNAHKLGVEKISKEHPDASDQIGQAKLKGLEYSYNALKSLNSEKGERFFVNKTTLTNNTKRTIRQITDELNEMVVKADPENKIKGFVPAEVSEVFILTEPGKPKVLEDGRLRVGEAKTKEPLTEKQQAYVESEQFKEDYYNSLEKLQLRINSANGKEKKILIPQLESLKGAGFSLGFEGKRLTDYIVPEADPTFSNGGSLDQSLQQVAQESMSALMYGDSNQIMPVIRKTISDIAEITMVSERKIATEIIRRVTELSTGGQQYAGWVTPKAVQELLSIKPAETGLADIETRLIDEPSQRVTTILQESIKGVTDKEQRSKLIGDTIKKEFPYASDDQVKVLKSVFGKELQAAEKQRVIEEQAPIREASVGVQEIFAQPEGKSIEGIKAPITEKAPTASRIEALRSDRGKKLYLYRLEALKRLYDKAPKNVKANVLAKIEEVIRLGQILGYENPQIKEFKEIIKKDIPAIKVEEIKKDFTPEEIAKAEADMAKEVNQEFVTDMSSDFSGDDIRKMRDVIKLLDTKYATGDFETMRKNPKDKVRLNNAIEIIEQSYNRGKEVTAATKLGDEEALTIMRDLVDANKGTKYKKNVKTQTTITGEEVPIEVKPEQRGLEFVPDKEALTQGAKTSVSSEQFKAGKTEALTEEQRGQRSIAQKSTDIFDNKTGLEYFDRLLNNNLVPGRKITEREYMQTEKGKTGEIVYMSPDEYLSKIAPAGPTQSSIDYMKAKLAKGEKLGMPHIDYTETTIGGKHPGQEGRNRAYLAKELGLKEIPVLEIRKYKTPEVIGGEKTKTTTKDYVAIIDQPDKRGNLWGSNTTRKLTESEAKPLLESGKIQEAAPVEPKRMVNITHPDGTQETITWGEYLKKRKQLRTTSTSEKTAPELEKQLADINKKIAEKQGMAVNELLERKLIQNDLDKLRSQESEKYLQEIYQEDKIMVDNERVNRPIITYDDTYSFTAIRDIKTKEIVDFRPNQQLNNAIGVTKVPQDATTAVTQFVAKQNRVMASAFELGKSSAPLGEMAAGRSAKLGEFEEVKPTEEVAKEESEPFKLFEKVPELIRKYAERTGTIVPKNAKGVYLPQSDYVGQAGATDIGTASHEVAHVIDTKYDISKQLTKVVGESVDGRPIYDSETRKLRKSLTDVYEKYYPTGNRTHKLQKRMVEGFGTLLENYTAMPIITAAEYPELVKELLTEGGKFYKPIIGELLTDLRTLIGDYQGLNAADKLGSKIVFGRINSAKGEWLSPTANFKYNTKDRIWPMEYAEIGGKLQWTEKSPSLKLRQIARSQSEALYNIKGETGNIWVNTALKLAKGKGFYATMADGNFKKLLDFNFSDLEKSLDGGLKNRQFNILLDARDTYFNYQRLQELKVGSEEYIKLKSQLDNDGTTKQEATDVYLEPKDKFDPQLKMFDRLMKDGAIEILLDSRRIGSEQATEWREKEGYAPKMRTWIDDLIGDAISEGRISIGRSGKVSVTKERVGSAKAKLPPLYAAEIALMEIHRAAAIQNFNNSMIDFANALPALAMRVPLDRPVVNPKTGQLRFEQDFDRTIIMARDTNGKRVPIKVDQLLLNVINNAATPKDMSMPMQIFRWFSKQFHKGTTGTYIPFIFNNIPLDAPALAAQTRNEVVPFFDSIKQIYASLNPKNPQHQMMIDYLISAGQTQTLSGMFDKTPEDMRRWITKETNALQTIKKYVDAGFDILATPVQISEVWSRGTEYIKAKLNGKSHVMAIEEAARVTGSFSHFGTWGNSQFVQEWMRSLPYFNAGIQVLGTMAETLGTAKGRARYAFVASIITAANIGNLVAMMAFASDEQKQEFADVNPQMLASYIFVPKSGGKGLWRIRVPEQMNTFAALVNMMVANEKLQANYTTKDFLDASTQWLPRQIQFTEPGSMILSWLPQAFKPAIGALTNTKDYPEVSPLVGAGLSRALPELQFNQGTSPVAKYLGKLLGWSPIKIDYFITGYLGRASQVLMGKPGALEKWYNPNKAISSEYYFQYGRRVSAYYDIKEYTDKQYTRYRNEIKEDKLTMSQDEIDKMFERKSQTSIIGSMLESYKLIDETKDMERAMELRTDIFDAIDKLFSEK